MYVSQKSHLEGVVEATALHMSNPLQIESLLEGSIMLGIGYFDLPLEEDEREQLGTRLLFRPQFGIACSKKRKLSKRTKPSLKDFRYDKFIVRRSGVCGWVRAFAPWILPSVRKF
jgi:hypothetical protein